MSGLTDGLARIPLSIEPLTKKDFTSDQEVRWCPGCGDYAILAAVQGDLEPARGADDLAHAVMPGRSSGWTMACSSGRFFI